MPQYLSPGVYVEELEASTRPVEGVGTAVAAFVGLAAEGPLHTPTLVTNWTQFTNAFGGFAPGCYLAHAVYGYFNNGGGAAYVVRVGSDTASDAGSAVPQPARAELLTGGDNALEAYAVESLLPGDAGRGTVVEVQHPEGGQDDTFTVEVRQGDGTRGSRA